MPLLSTTHFNIGFSMPKSSARHKPVRNSRRSELTFLTGPIQKTLLFGLALCNANLVLGQSEQTRENDWVPLEQLSEQQKQQIKPGCDGLYLDPMQSVQEKLGDKGSDLDAFPLEIEADQSLMQDGELAILEGNVEVSQGARRIHADKMTYDMTQDQAELEGEVVIRQPGVLLQGSKALANGVDHSASFENADFVLHPQHLRGGAKSISQSANKVIELENGAFTSCEPGSNTWVLEGESITIDTENQQGEGKNIKLKVMDIPILYLPYITFPVGDKRKSGLLFPSIGISEKNGIDLAIPYYFNLAPNYDATVTPRVIGKRGFMLELEGRHLSENFSTLGDIAFLANDRGGRDPALDEQIANGFISEEEARPYKGENRWLGHFGQQGGANKSWYTEIDYSRASDNDYFRDLGTTSFSLQNTSHLNQAALAGYRSTNWHFSALVNDYQILLYDVDDPYQRLPQLNANGHYQLGAYSLNLLHDYTHFDHADDIWRNGSTIVKGQRMTTDYRLNINRRAPWGFFKPELGVQTLGYLLDQQSISEAAERAPLLATGLASLDTGLIFEHAGGNYLQTLEPRAYYIFRSYDDHSDLFDVTDDGQNVNFDTSERTFSYSQLYRDSRFSGSDRLEDANRLTLGITSNWFDNDSGEEHFSISVGQIFYFDDQKVSLDQGVVEQNRSEFAGELRLRMGPWGRFFAGAIYDDGEANKFSRGTAGVQLTSPSYKTLVNLAYSYVSDTSSSTPIDQLDSAFITPISKQWAAMARYNYDYISKRELEVFFGLEYNDCCYRARLLARRWLDSNIAALTESEDGLYDQGMFFEIHLKGLGSSGAKVASILEDSIYGFREREESLNHR